MSILALFVWLVIIGMIVYLINAYIPLPTAFHRLIQIVGIILAILLILSAFGILNAVETVRVPVLR